MYNNINVCVFVTNKYVTDFYEYFYRGERITLSKDLKNSLVDEVYRSLDFKKLSCTKFTDCIQNLQRDNWCCDVVKSWFPNTWNPDLGHL